MTKMPLFEFSNANDFLRIAQHSLEQNESANTLSLGIAQVIRDEPQRYCETPFLAVILNDNKDLILSAVMTPPYPLIIQVQDSQEYAIKQLIDYILKRRLKLSGVNGMAQASSAFAEQWQVATGVKIRSKMALRIYELKQVKMPDLPEGQFRAATQKDQEIIMDWFQAFQLEVISEDERSKSYGHILRAIEKGNVFVWEAGRQLVSMAILQRPTTHAATVSGVYTPPDQRNKGYASACVAMLSQTILDRGYQFANLFTDLANPTSNAIYQAIGYKPICDFHKYMFQ